MSGNGLEGDGAVGAGSDADPHFAWVPFVATNSLPPGCPLRTGVHHPIVRIGAGADR